MTTQTSQSSQNPKKESALLLSRFSPQKTPVVHSNGNAVKKPIVIKGK